MAVINVSVVLATPERQQLVSVCLPKGSCAWDAVLEAQKVGLDVDVLIQSASALTAEHSDILDKASTTIGVYGRVVEKDYCVEEGDRIELYRPLILDPMEQRRRRALEK